MRKGKKGRGEKGNGEKGKGEKGKGKKGRGEKGNGEKGKGEMSNGGKGRREMRKGKKGRGEKGKLEGYLRKKGVTSPLFLYFNLLSLPSPFHIYIKYNFTIVAKKLIDRPQKRIKNISGRRSGAGL
jgi:hypothetical protein